MSFAFFSHKSNFRFHITFLYNMILMNLHIECQRQFDVKTKVTPIPSIKKYNKKLSHSSNKHRAATFLGTNKSNLYIYLDHQQDVVYVDKQTIYKIGASSHSRNRYRYPKLESYDNYTKRISLENIH